MCVFIYIHTSTYIFTYMYIYIYIRGKMDTYLTKKDTWGSHLTIKTLLSSSAWGAILCTSLAQLVKLKCNLFCFSLCDKWHECCLGASSSLPLTEGQPETPFHLSSWNSASYLFKAPMSQFLNCQQSEIEGGSNSRSGENCISRDMMVPEVRQEVTSPCSGVRCLWGDGFCHLGEAHHFLLWFIPFQCIPSPASVLGTQLLVETWALGQLLCFCSWSVFSTYWNSYSPLYISVNI